MPGEYTELVGKAPAVPQLITGVGALPTIAFKLIKLDPEFAASLDAEMSKKLVLS
jgi:hypothetical protein